MKARQLIGTVLVFLAAAFTVYLAVIMIRRISGVVLKASYEEIFRY